MAIQLTDAEIISLLSEPKALPSDYQSRLQLRPKTGHKERELETKGYDPLANLKKAVKILGTDSKLALLEALKA
jgi:hypothetical protein